MKDHHRRVAVLIDAENMSASSVQKVLETAGRCGEIVERRIYGDFCHDSLRRWIDVCARYALSPQTTIATASGKNSADILLAIDAIEMLCAGAVDVFCIASSDSDFTQLAMRIRMRGCRAVGVGGDKASNVLRSAYDEFVVVNELSPITKAVVPAARKSASLKITREPSNVVALTPKVDIRPYIDRAFDLANHPTDEWLDIARLGSLLRQAYPGFQLKTFGSGKFSKVLGQCAFLETKMHGTNRMQIRLRQSS